MPITMEDTLRTCSHRAVLHDRLVHTEVRKRTTDLDSNCALYMPGPLLVRDDGDGDDDG